MYMATGQVVCTRPGKHDRASSSRPPVRGSGSHGRSERFSLQEVDAITQASGVAQTLLASGQVTQIGVGSVTTLVDVQAVALALAKAQAAALALAQAQALALAQAQAQAQAAAQALAQEQALALQQAQAQELAQARALAQSEGQALALSQQELAQARAQALALAQTQTQSGLTWYRYDQGYFNDNPGWFQGQTATASGVTTGWSDISRSTGAATPGFLPIAQTNRFSFLVSGYFVAQVTGSHQLKLSSDDAAYMWIGPAALGAAASVSIGSASINLAGLHGNNGQSVNVSMVAGQAYPVLIMYGQNEGGYNLQFSFIPPGASETTDGSRVFFTSLPAGAQVMSPSAATTGPAGLTWYRYDQGYFNDNPSWFQGLTASASGVTNGWSDLARSPGAPVPGILPIAQTSRFSFLVSGYFVAQVSGNYQLTLSSDDAAYLWIGPPALGAAASVSTGNASIKLGGLHGNNAQSVNMAMVSGQAYPLLMMYGQNEGGWNFTFSFNPPGASSTTDGTGYFFTTSTAPQGATAPAGFSGRYVKLTKPVTGCMHFAEVQVFSTSGGTNIASGKTVTASSTGWGGLPEFLTDGIMNNFTHSNCVDAPWFLIDLGSVMSISNIRVFNRTDCCQSRENGVVVTVLDANQSVVFTSNPLADKKGVTVDGGDNGSTYSVFDINPPSTVVNGEEGQTTFHLQDVTTGALVTYSSGSNKVAEDPGASVVNWKIFNDGSVYHNDQGAVGVCDDSTSNCMRHSGWVMWEGTFVPNNVDFAWVFKKTGTANVYTLYNFYQNNTYLNFNGSQLLISTDSPRQWLVVGSAAALALVQGVSR